MTGSKSTPTRWSTELQSTPITTKHVFGVPASNDVFVSSQAEYLPRTPSSVEGIGSIFSVLNPRYATDQYFYLALVPLVVEMPGPVLDCLAAASIQFEAATGQRGVDGYRLALGKQQAWERCECILREIEHRLLLRAGDTYLEMATPPCPYSFGYTRVWPSISKLREQLKMAIIAFVARLALISYLVLKEESRGISTWDELSDGANAVPQSITNALRLTWISDWSVLRVGAFVDIGHSISPSSGIQWHRDIPLFLSTGSCIPLWFAFPDSTLEVTATCPSLTAAIYALYRPDDCWFESLPAVARGVFAREVDDKTGVRTPWNYCYSTVTLTTGILPVTLHLRRRGKFTTHYTVHYSARQAICYATSTYAPPHSSIFHKHLSFNHRQRAGEDYEAFMERNIAEQNSIRLRETDDERQSREARETAQATQEVPSGTPPSIYLWTYSTSLGLALRTRVSFSDVRSLWESTSPSMRIYNPFRDEYDIYPLPPISNSGHSPQDSNDEITDEQLRVGCDPSSGSGPLPSIDYRMSITGNTIATATDHCYTLSANSGEDSLPCHSLKDSIVALSTSTGFPTMSTLNAIEGLRIRFGFVAHNSALDNSPVVFNDSRAAVFRRLGSWSHSDSVSQSLLALLEEFVSAIIKHSTPPEEVFDLATLYTGERKCCFVKMDHWPSKFYYSPLHEAFPAGNVCAHVVLKSAHAVHFARRGGFDHNLEALTTGLITFGIPFEVYWLTDFTTPLRRTIPGHHLLGGRPVGVGVVPHKTSIGVDDYNTYQHICHNALCGELGAVALQQGGLLWRLAYGCRGWVVPVQEVLCYPEGSGCLTRKNAAENGLVGSSQLSEQDEYMLLGAYRVLTPQSDGDGKAKHVPDGALVSWWPLQDRWLSSALNVGYWSEQAETWFQSRLTSIKSGEAHPLTNRQWSKVLRPARRGFFEAHEQLCSEYI